MTLKEWYSSWKKKSILSNKESSKLSKNLTTTQTNQTTTSTSTTPVTGKKRKITVVSIASNQQGIKIDGKIEGGDQEIKSRRSVSTIRLDKVISEIQDFHYKTELQLKKSVQKQAKVLAWFFVIFVVYIMFGVFVFFYVEECSGSSVSHDGSVPNIYPKLKMPEHKNLTETCISIYMNFVKHVLHDINTTDFDDTWNNTSAFQSFSVSCQQIVVNSTLPVVVKAALSRNCSVNAVMLLKYAEFAIFTLLTIGYGNTVPTTTVGRMLLIMYAVIGIPLAVTMYSVAGKLLVQVITLIVRMFESRVFKMTKEVAHIQLKTLFISIFLMIIIMLTGCAVTTSSRMEDLDFLSSFYFWFVSLTTVGYGDIHFARNKHLDNPHLMLLSACNLLFGLGIMAAIIEAFSLALEKKNLQMSTIIIDEEGYDEEEGEDQKQANEDKEMCDAVFRLYKDRVIEEHELVTNTTELSPKSNGSATSSNGITSCNGHVNLAHTNDDDVYLTDLSPTPDTFRNGHLK